MALMFPLILMCMKIVVDIAETVQNGLHPIT